MKVFLFANTDWYLFNFRRPLIRKLISLGHDVTLLIPKGRFQVKLEGEGFSCITVPLHRRGRFGISDLISICRLLRIYAVHRPDVVHHFTVKAVLYGMLCAKITRVPFRINAITGMGYLFTEAPRRSRLSRFMVATILRRLLSGRQTQTVVQNKHDGAFLEEMGIASPDSIHLIPGSGIDVSAFSPANRLANNRVRVLMASRYLADKGIREYIEAAKCISAKRDDVEFLLAGEADVGNPTHIKQEEIEGWQHIKGFRNLGYVEDIREILYSINIFVLPSYREGLPRSLLEASSCEIPIVTTDVPGCNDVVQHEVNGLLVPARSVPILVDAIERLMASKELRAKMGMNGRRRVGELFSEEFVLRKTCEIYNTFDQIKLA